MHLYSKVHWSFFVNMKCFYTYFYFELQYKKRRGVLKLLKIFGFVQMILFILFAHKYIQHKYFLGGHIPFILDILIIVGAVLARRLTNKFNSAN